MSTFVSVGNATQPFARLLDAVAAVARELPQPVFVQSGSTPFRCDGVQNMPWLAMADFERHVVASELLVLHAGAGSVINAVHAGKVPVVMARLARHGEHVDDHQVEFARELGRAGRIVVAEKPEGLMRAVEDALRRQRSAAPSHEAPAMIGMIAEVLRRYANP